MRIFFLDPHGCNRGWVQGNLGCKAQWYLMNCCWYWYYHYFGPALPGWWWGSRQLGGLHCRYQLPQGSISLFRCPLWDPHPHADCRGAGHMDTYVWCTSGSRGPYSSHDSTVHHRHWPWNKARPLSPAAATLSSREAKPPGDSCKPSLLLPPSSGFQRVLTGTQEAQPKAAQVGGDQSSTGESKPAQPGTRQNKGQISSFLTKVK